VNRIAGKSLEVSANRRKSPATAASSCNFPLSHDSPPFHHISSPLLSSLQSKQWLATETEDSSVAPLKFSSPFWRIRGRLADSFWLPAFEPLQFEGFLAFYRLSGVSILLKIVCFASY
jgi:hypothetical protein